MATLGEALALAELGQYLFPVNMMKKPLTRHGVYDASRDVATIRTWFDTYPDPQMAVATGSGLCVVDLDAHPGQPDGRKTYQGFGIGDMGEPISLTPHGEHHWFSTEQELGNGTSRIGPGIDHRGKGGYVLVPDSQTLDGPYLWLRPLSRDGIPDMPHDLVERLTKQPDDTRPGEWLPATSVDATIRRLRCATEGTRNDTLNLCAYLCGRLIATGNADETTARSLLLETALAIGLTEREARATIKSGLGDGMAARGCMPLEQYRQDAMNALAWAMGSPWPGRGGVTDRRVYLAHVLQALKVGGASYDIDVRTLGELANTSHMTAATATRRLIEQGRLQRVNMGGRTLTDSQGGMMGMYASSYSLVKVCIIFTHNQHIGEITETPAAITKESNADLGDVARAGSLPVTVVGRQAMTSATVEGLAMCSSNAHSHDAFSWSGLGASAAQVYDSLRRQGPATVAELVGRTGRSRRTVHGVLHRMSHLVNTVTGAVFAPLVVKDGRLWTAQETDLDALARFLGVDGRGRLRKAQHERERESFTQLCQEKSRRL